MDAPADPPVSTEALAATLGLPTFQLRLWLRAGAVDRVARGVPVLAALTGVLTALRHETAMAKSYRPAPIPKPGDALDEMVEALSADLTRIAEGRENSPVADEIARMIDRLPGHRRRALKGGKA